MKFKHTVHSDINKAIVHTALQETQAVRHSLARANNIDTTNVQPSLLITLHWSVLSRLSSRIPPHRSKVHVCECDSERSLHPLRLHVLLYSYGAVQVYPPGIQGSDRFLETIFQCSSFFAQGHNCPDGDLHTAGRSDANAQRFTPPWIHIGPVVEWCVVHLHEDVNQDEQQ